MVSFLLCVDEIYTQFGLKFHSYIESDHFFLLYNHYITCLEHSTYIGDEYACVQESIIPFMNSNIEAGEASFIAHAGDIFGGGSGVSQNKKCNDHVFQSRQDLFKGGTNLLLTTGDVRVNNFSLLSLVVCSLFPSNQHYPLLYPHRTIGMNGKSIDLSLLFLVHLNVHELTLIDSFWLVLATT